MKPYKETLIEEKHRLPEDAKRLAKEHVDTKPIKYLLKN